MLISVIRDEFSYDSTGSLVLVNGAFYCYGLEPPKAPNAGSRGFACIPPDDYEVVPHDSPLGDAHWKSPVMPMVTSVPGRQFILIHPGNFPKDTDGCLLLGERRQADFVGPSEPIWRALFAKIQAAWAARERVQITYREVPQQ